MIWGNIHGFGLGSEDRLGWIWLVKFKKPERNSYKDGYVIGRQMNKYMDQLKEERTLSYNCEPIVLSKDVAFHCYSISDLVGT
ncbi:hypothetical protein AB9K35_17280 [Leisingera sp. XS_AS12]|uniref:hypothetical protein n=1 Tax=Leisingera sp. XS_AS12 TaxID=3241294 RepID=UPI003517E18A